MHLEKFIHSTNGRYLMSVILGIGIACLFRETCKGPKCEILKAPKLTDIKDKIYKFNNECYKITENSIKCDDERRTIPFS